MNTKLIELTETDSTNSYLRAYKPAADEEMTVAVATYQRRGRGQGTNTWESEPGKNLLFSILVHPLMLPVAGQFVISEAVALSVRDALSAYTDCLTIKWPNDIYWNDRKICGILIENKIAGGRIHDCILGVGINVNQRLFTSPAPNPVSLVQITGTEVPPREVLDRVLRAFGSYYDCIVNGDYMAITAPYHEALYCRSGFHRFCDEDGEFEAAIVEVEDDGHLILRDRTGHARSYAFKEVAFCLPSNP
ncbi:biotin--[acetyl-CoA-carboxylase] ligase [Prevotella sp. kh1p2]|uniref:biotin--[acetyl-CoA-carboxylase] ligase n=1 Tax=Prevotella sp. kh1p2 TaxID=1761883 RepID=UPI0008D6BC45|nr:biotin--[acetyl-CoA-carboxylase] ligase [Prevotella sp. kh1p2]SES76947.1 BirA family transcriptional regulator, biotin operon repressor / biotin-[acetyl-CoA-carboxylase] ligase [Prevotella sp. kh1p2]SNU10456.1 BirA family transcriptional regulator, biotin operon repressor / biotin-[acetyl-CoA-carboxylase] ligase [Prevotellaceae bacterium KH2P17]